MLVYEVCWCMMPLTHDIIMMQYWIAVLENIAIGAIHSVSGHSTSIQYRMHVNTPTENCGSESFPVSGYSIRI